jgi:hypothetical protein
LRLDELQALMASTVVDRENAFCTLPMGLDQLLAASFPVEGGADEIRRAFAEDLGRNRLGLGVREQQGMLLFAFPIVVLAGTKPSC